MALQLYNFNKHILFGSCVPGGTQPEFAQLSLACKAIYYALGVTDGVSYLAKLLAKCCFFGACAVGLASLRRFMLSSKIGTNIKLVDRFKDDRPLSFNEPLFVQTLVNGVTSEYVANRYTFRYIGPNVIRYRDLRDNTVSYHEMFRLGPKGKFWTYFYLETLMELWYILTGTWCPSLRIPIGYIVVDYSQTYLGNSIVLQSFVNRRPTIIRPRGIQPLELYDCRRGEISISRVGKRVYISLARLDTCVSMESRDFDRYSNALGELNRSNFKCHSKNGKQVYTEYEWLDFNEDFKRASEATFTDVPTACVLPAVTGAQRKMLFATLKQLDPEITDLTEPEIPPLSTLEELDHKYGTEMVKNKVTISASPEKETEALEKRSCAVAHISKQGLKDPSAKQSGRILCKPLIYPCWSIPFSTKADVELMELLRFNKYPQTFNSKAVASFEGAMQEFAKMFFSKGKPRPVESQEIWDKQTKRSQKRILQTASIDAQDGPNLSCEGFTKAECNSTAKPLRPIVIHHPKEKEAYSRYCLSVTNLMKQNKEHFHWYAFGRDLNDIAAAIAGKAMRAKVVGETDFSAFDVTVNELVRRLEHIFLHIAFEGNREVLQLHSGQFFNDIYFGKGEDSVKINNSFGRKSGSPETAMFNSIVNAFVAFCVFRSQGLSIKEAWNALGMYGGDDGVTFDANEKAYSEVVAGLGLVIKYKNVKQGEIFTFLAREYTDAWAGKLCNRPILTRILGHFHFTSSTNSGLKDEELLHMKAMALLRTDKNHPIVSRLAKKIIDLTSPKLGAKAKALTEKLMEAVDPFAMVEGTGLRVLDFIGFWTNSSELCEECAKQTLTLVSDKELKRWTEKLSLAKTVDELPVLDSGNEPEPFKEPWVQFHYNHKTKRWNLENLEEPTLPADKVPKVRVIQIDGLEFCTYTPNPWWWKKKNQGKAPAASAAQKPVANKAGTKGQPKPKTNSKPAGKTKVEPNLKPKPPDPGPRQTVPVDLSTPVKEEVVLRNNNSPRAKVDSRLGEAEEATRPPGLYD